MITPLLRFVAIAFVALVAQLAMSQAASSHAVGTSYIAVEQNASTSMLQVRVDLTLRDLEFAIGLDRNGDGQITWGEVVIGTQAIADYVEHRLQVSEGDAQCALHAPDIAIDHHADEIYA